MLKTKGAYSVTRHTFLLQQFRPGPEAIRPCLAVSGSIARQGSEMSLQYLISGDIHFLDIPRQRGLGKRCHGLWQESCFECFIGMKDSRRYWEINLAATGDWNVYSFNGYRQGMVEETAFNVLPCTFYETKDEIWLDLKLDLSLLVREEHALEIGISSVLKHRNGETSYWALCHREPQPDFHHRSGFLLAM